MYQMNNKNLFRITCTQVSYQILTCVRVFLWKERIHSHSIDCIKTLYNMFLWVFLNKNVYFDPKYLYLCIKIHYYVLYNKKI